MRRSGPIVVALAIGCAKLPPPPPAKPMPASSGKPRRAVGPLVALGWKGDHVGSVDGPVAPDGAVDFGFRVRVSGEVESLFLMSSDLAGKFAGINAWDTIAGPTPIPTAWGTPFKDGRYTWSIAVLDAQGNTLNPKGTLEKTTFDDELVDVFASDPPKIVFLPGRTFTLLVVRPDGAVDRATTTLL